MSKLIPLISIFKQNLSNILLHRSTKYLKEDESYVSEGDYLMDSICIDFLNNCFTSIQIITEESYQGGLIDIFASEYVAIVDPIDGTENFVSGLKEWGSGVCLYKNGVFEEALIAIPELNEYLHSDDLILRNYDSRIHALSSSLNKEDFLNLPAGFEYRIIGCCMYNMFNVITGSFMQFENPKGARSWDILPGLNIALNKGLNVFVNNQIYNGEFLQSSEKYTFRITS